MLGMMKSGFNFGGLPVLFGISVLLVFQSALAFAEVTAENFGLDETTIIEFTNNSGEPVNIFRLWLGSDYEFKSFKAQKGWIGEKTPQGVIVFSSSDSLKVGESVKFGIKTDKKSDGLNWKAIDSKNNQIGIGKSLQKNLKSVENNSPIENKNITNLNSYGINDNSSIRIIPENPNPGSKIRIVGDNFQPNSQLDLFIDDKKSDIIISDESGNFIFTDEIPQEISSEIIQIKIKDISNEKILNIKLGKMQNNIQNNLQIKFTMNTNSNILKLGDILEINGKSTPNSTVTLQIIYPNGDIIKNYTIQSDYNGDWIIENYTVPIDTYLGKYEIKASDGNQIIIKKFDVITNKIIIVESDSIKYDVGESINFNFSGTPNQKIEYIIEDPIGKQILDGILELNEDGKGKLDLETNFNFIKGTYVLTTIHDDSKERNYFGLGVFPDIPIIIETDKLNYKTGEITTIKFSGKPNSEMNFLLLDPNDKIKIDSIPIKLGNDGTFVYELVVEKLSNGIYTIVAKNSETESNEKFSVGLQFGSGKIQINPIKEKYLPGESVLVLGTTEIANTLVKIELVDKDNKIFDYIETFSNKDGKFITEELRIPLDMIPGKLNITAKSGGNFSSGEIEVLSLMDEGLKIIVEEGETIGAIGKTVLIKISNSKQSVEINIYDPFGEMIEELSFVSSKDGKINQPWIIPKELPSGIYTFKASDAFSEDSTSIQLN